MQRTKVCAPRASTQPGVETKEAQRAVPTKITRRFLEYLSLIPAFSLCRYKTEDWIIWVKS